MEESIVFPALRRILDPAQSTKLLHEMKQRRAYLPSW
jgi:hypothetical protein